MKPQIKFLKRRFRISESLKDLIEYAAMVSALTAAIGIFFLLLIINDQNLKQFIQSLI